MFSLDFIIFFSNSVDKKINVSVTLYTSNNYHRFNYANNLWKYIYK